MNSLYTFIKGILIGSGAILPGISSGVICMVLGLYEKLLNSILSFFKDIKGNFKFLFPIISGAIIGIILFSNLISYCFNINPCQTKSLFIGLLLGSIYILAISNVANKNLKFPFISLKKFNILFKSFSYNPNTIQITPLLIPGSIAPDPI